MRRKRNYHRTEVTLMGKNNKTQKTKREGYMQKKMQMSKFVQEW